MGSPVQTVSFASPQAILAPNLAVQQQQYERQMALANALRSQALTDTNPGRGSVSWTQGLSRLANALLANSEYKKADTQLGSMAQNYAAAIRGEFGGSPSLSTSPMTAPSSAPAQSSASTPTDQVSNIPGDRGVYGSGGVEDNGNLPDPSQQPAANPPAAVAPAPAAPSPAPGPQSYTPGPLSLTGNPNIDMTMYAMDPQGYMHAVETARSPVDMAKTVQQAQAAAARGDYATAAALYGNIRKQNFVAPVNVRQGSTVIDPNTHQPIFTNPRTPEGAVADFGPNGQPTGVSMLPGAPGAIATESGAKAAGQAAYSPMQVFDPNTGAPIYQTKAQVAQSAAGGNPMMAGPKLGDTAAYDVTGKNSANEFQNISNGAADAQTRKYALSQMSQIVQNPASQFGAGSAGLNRLQSTLATIGNQLGFATDPKAASNADEFNKWATQYSARSGQELGLSGSDARTQLAIHATPNGEMTRQALQSIIPQMMGIENAKLGHANASVQWQQSHGPASYQQFATQWSANYDPRIYTWLADGSVAKHMAALKKSNPADYNALVHKATVLGQMGAFVP